MADSGSNSGSRIGGVGVEVIGGWERDKRGKRGQDAVCCQDSPRYFPIEAQGIDRCSTSQGNLDELGRIAQPLATTLMIRNPDDAVGMIKKIGFFEVPSTMIHPGGETGGEQ